MAPIRLIVVEIRKLELDTTIIIITKVRHNTTPTTTILRSGAPRLKVDEGELVECKIVIFLPLAGCFPHPEIEETKKSSGRETVSGV